METDEDEGVFMPPPPRSWPLRVNHDHNRQNNVGGDERMAEPEIETGLDNLMALPKRIPSILLPRGTYELPKLEFVPEIITDPVEANKIHMECAELFHSRQITPDNAFKLKLLECFEIVTRLDGINNASLQTVGKTLEIGTKIYSMRMEKTVEMVKELANGLAENEKECKRKRKMGSETQEDAEGPGPGAELGENDYFDEGDVSLSTTARLDPREKQFNILDDGTAIPLYWGSGDYDKENPNIVSDSDLTMEEVKVEDKGEFRRLKLKECFDTYVNGRKRFDYTSFVCTKPVMEEKMNCEPVKTNLITFNPSMINRAEMALFVNLGFVRFPKGTYDSECFDIWGSPLNTIGVMRDADQMTRMLEKRRQVREQLREGFMNEQNVLNAAGTQVGVSEDPFALGANAGDLGPDSEPFDLSAGVVGEEFRGVDPEEVVQGEPEFVQDDYNPIDENGRIKPITIGEVRTLEDYDTHYDKVRRARALKPTLYGWEAPVVVRSRKTSRRRNASRSRSRKSNPPSKVLIIGNTDWERPDNRFNPKPYAETELDEDELGPSPSQQCNPYFECEEDNEVDCWTLEDTFESTFFSARPSVHRLTRFYTDNARCILTGELIDKTIPLEELDVTLGGLRMGNDTLGGLGMGNDTLGGLGMGNDATLAENSLVGFGGDGFGFGPNDFDSADHDSIEGLRQIERDYYALGADDNEISQQDIDIMRRHKMLGFDFGSEAEEYALSNFSDTEPLRYARGPKPINMRKVKNCITQVLISELGLDESGQPTKAEKTEIEMSNLIVEMMPNLDENTTKHLSMSIILVALLHVAVELKLFVDTGKLGARKDPLIICHGKNWKHKDHIPGFETMDPPTANAGNEWEAYEEDVGEEEEAGPAPRKRRRLRKSKSFEKNSPNNGSGRKVKESQATTSSGRKEDNQDEWSDMEVDEVDLDSPPSSDSNSMEIGD